jgi:hypothetical protein
MGMELEVYVIRKPRCRRATVSPHRQCLSTLKPSCAAEVGSRIAFDPSSGPKTCRRPSRPLCFQQLEQTVPQQNDISSLPLLLTNISVIMRGNISRPWERQQSRSSAYPMRPRRTFSPSPRKFPHPRLNDLPPLYSSPRSVSSCNDTPHNCLLPQFLPPQVSPSLFYHLSPVSNKDASSNLSSAFTAPFWLEQPPLPPPDWAAGVC